MPTVILLDVSLSMAKPVAMTDCSEEYQKRHLAVHGINSFLDRLNELNKLEFVALSAFSSLHETVVPFTRDFDQIKTKLNKVECYDKTCLEGALSAVSSLVLEEWGCSTSCQIIWVTDGTTGHGDKSLKNFVCKYNSSNEKPLHFPFPCKLHVACLENPQASHLSNTLAMYEKLINVVGQAGDVFLPEGALSLKNVENMFGKLTEKYYAPSHGLLRCGNLQCNVVLYPPPDVFKKDDDFESICKKVSDEFDIVGFLNCADIESPPYISRHLMLPYTDKPVKTEVLGEVREGEEEKEDGRVPSLTVLLHGSLKVSKMVALVQVGVDWYGMLYSWADSRKKSNLMLSVFEPGVDALPWLGPLNLLGPVQGFDLPPYGEDDDRSPFPVRQVDKRSYAQTTIVWIKSAGLQADIQKILRHARKLPEKLANFYKELNRVRKAALSLGFTELLESVSAMLERECRLLPGTAHPEAALQLSHAASCLKMESAKDFSHTVKPLPTNFTGE